MQYKFRPPINPYLESKMKTFAVLTLALCAPLFSQAARAADVVDARVDERAGTIEIDVRYGGGCKEHNFKLEVGNACAESMPVQCRAKLVDLTSGDFCEALVGKTVVFSIKKLGLDTDYFRGASLTITGDRDSSKTVHLPR
jgi:hypothetical protein